MCSAMSSDVEEDDEYSNGSNGSNDDNGKQECFSGLVVVSFGLVLVEGLDLK